MSTLFDWESVRIILITVFAGTGLYYLWWFGNSISLINLVLCFSSIGVGLVIFSFQIKSNKVRDKFAKTNNSKNTEGEQ